MEGLRAEALSERRRRILDGVAAGKSNGVLADELGISVDGVKWHVSELLGESGAADRRELGAWWRRTRAAAPAIVAPSWRSRRALTEGARFAFGVAFTALLVLGVVAGWRCSGGAAPATTVAPASPLGKIAYVLDGDIWTKALPDGTPQQITHRTKKEVDSGVRFSAPHWSPTGHRLSALKGTEAIIMLADGSESHGFPGSQFAWSPTNDQLAYNAAGDGQASSEDLVVEDASGLNRDVIARCFAPADETCSMTDITWRDDGSEVAYVEHHQRAGTTVTRTYEAIMHVGAVGTAPPTVAYAQPSPPKDGIGILSWDSPGIMLVYTVPSFTADLADGVRLYEVHPGSEGGLITLSLDGPTMLLDPSLWSSSPRDLTAITSGSGRESWTNKRIATFSRATANAVSITPAGLAAIQPAISPDRAQVAYAAAPDAGTLSQIGGPSEPPAQPLLAKRKLYDVSMSDLGKATGCTVSDCVLPARQLTSDPAYRDEYPQWSADGRQILFARLRPQDDHWSLWLVPAAGGDPSQVVPDIDGTFLDGDAPVWFGSYGTIPWHDVLAWWRG